MQDGRLARGCTTAPVRVILIAGPTASGKSSLALELAERLNGEIVSADSMQVYRGLDIGTAKVSPALRAQIPHHLIDICELYEEFNVVKFYHLARKAIFDIEQRGRVPIVVGGTGFYLHALLYGPPEGPPASREIRAQLTEELQKFGCEPLYYKLKAYDPYYARTITSRDYRKIVRALEIMTLTGQRVSSLPRGSRPLPEFDYRCWFVYFPKDILFQRIDRRCEEMLEQGLIEEVGLLIGEGLRENPAAAHSIGYRQFLQFLLGDRGEAARQQAIIAFKRATRRYAKRQFTWFGQEPLFQWLDVSEGEAEVRDSIIRDYYISG